MSYGIDVMWAIVSGAVVGGGILLFVMAVRGLPVRPGRPTRDRDLRETLRSMSGRLAVAAVAAVLTLVLTRWVIAAIGTALLVLGWNGIAGGAAEERRAMARLEGLAAWTESLRDTIAGAVGLEQAIPSSLRGASPALQQPLPEPIEAPLRTSVFSTAQSASV